MHARAFVLYPLAELVAELQLPDGRSSQPCCKPAPSAAWNASGIRASKASSLGSSARSSARRRQALR